MDEVEVESLIDRCINCKSKIRSRLTLLTFSVWRVG